MNKDDVSVNTHRVIQDAIAHGVSAEDQYATLSKALERCKDRADAIQGIVPHVDAEIQCLKLSKMLEIIGKNLAFIDGQIFPDGYDHSPLNPEQPHADKMYDAEFWEYLGESPDEIEKAFRHLQSLPYNNLVGARMRALSDLYEKKDWRLPTIDPNAPPPTLYPGDQQDEQPDLGDTEMRASSVRRRSRRSRADSIMPIAEYWSLGTGAEPTVHFVAECPAAPIEQFEVQLLEEAMHPLDLAEELGDHACGTCLRMMEASDKEGFLFGSVTPRRTLAIWRDHIDYESHGLFGIGSSQLTVATDNIDFVDFPSFTELVFSTPDSGEIKVHFDRDAEGDIAVEAFRRLGWTFEND